MPPLIREARVLRNAFPYWLKLTPSQPSIEGVYELSLEDETSEDCSEDSAEEDSEDFWEDDSEDCSEDFWEDDSDEDSLEIIVDSAEDAPEESKEESLDETSEDDATTEEISAVPDSTMEEVSWWAHPKTNRVADKMEIRKDFFMASTIMHE